jgi:hypothetical protein
MIPDVKLPFDVENVIKAEVAEEDDAFVVYQKILSILSDRSKVEEVMAEPSISNNSSSLSLDDIAQRMLAHNPHALAEYLRAGEMPQAGGPSLKTADFSTDLSLHQDLRKLARTYKALGIAFDQAGEVEKAWACYRANLQCSIHAEQPGLGVCVLIGTACRAITLEPISKWASNPAISPERLRAARIDVEREFARRISLFDMNKAEHLCLRNTLQDRDWANLQLPTPAADPLMARPLLWGKRALLWCLGQPELAMRLQNQIFLNNRAGLDTPLHLRRRSVLVSDQGIVIFERDPADPHIPGQLDAAKLVRMIENNSPLSRIQNTFLIHLAGIDEARRRDNAKLATLLVLFAVQEYHRVHCHFPATLDELVPAFLNEVPFDPLATDGAPVKYRRDGDCNSVVWSLGPNRIDNQGVFHEQLDIGFQIQLNETQKRD